MRAMQEQMAAGGPNAEVMQMQMQMGMGMPGMLGAGAGDGAAGNPMMSVEDMDRLMAQLSAGGAGSEAQEDDADDDQAPAGRIVGARAV